MFRGECIQQNKCICEYRRIGCRLNSEKCRGLKIAANVNGWCASCAHHPFQLLAYNCSGLWVLSRLLALLGVLAGLGCLRVLSLLGVLSGLGLSCRRRVLAGLGCLRVLALLRVLAAHGLDGVLALGVLAALGLGLLAVADDNECANAADDNDCQDQQEDPPRAGRGGRGGRRGGVRCRGSFAGRVGVC